MPVQQEQSATKFPASAENEKQTEGDAVSAPSLHDGGGDAGVKRSMSKDVILICTVAFAAILTVSASASFEFVLMIRPTY